MTPLKSSAAPLRLILATGQVTELTALEATTATTPEPRAESVGYFNDPAKLAAEVGKIATAKGIYFTPNPVKPALLAQAQNRLKDAGKSETSSDKDIIRRLACCVDMRCSQAGGNLRQRGRPLRPHWIGR